MAQYESAALLYDTDSVDRFIGRQLEAAAAMGKLDKVTGQQQMLGRPVIVKPRTRQHHVLLKVAFRLHQGMQVMGNGAFLSGEFEARAADAAKDKQAV